MATRRSSVSVKPSSGNLFADLGLPDRLELDIRVRLAMEVVRALDDQQLSLAAAAKILRINRPSASALRRYQLDAFSAGRLMTFLTVLGRDVTIRVAARSRGAAQGRVLVDAV